MAIIFQDNNFLIRSGTNQTNPAVVPPASSNCELRMGRDNWPAAGVTLRIQFTYNDVDWVTIREEFIAAGIFNPKTGQIDPASIGFGWGHDPQPLHARIETVSPSQFRAPVTVDVT